MKSGKLGHDELVGFIYDCIEDEAGLGQLQRQLMTQFDADTGNIFLLGEGGRLLEDRLEGPVLETHLPYHDDYRAQDPRFRIAMAHPGRVFSDVEVICQQAFLGSPIYNDWLRPAGVRFTMFVNLPAGPDLSIAQALMRPLGSAAFDSDAVSGLQRVLPHLQRAVRLRQSLRAARDERGDLRRALDLGPLPSLVLDGAGRVVCMSARAEAALQTPCGLTVHQQRLSAVRSEDAAAIVHALRLTSNLADPTVQQRKAVQVPPLVEISREDGPPLSLIFMPLRPDHGLRQAGDARARVLVGIYDPRAILRLNPALIARVHALTGTESELAASLAEGDTLEEFARKRGCSVQTARTHLKRVLEKTGTRKQADLVRVLLAGAAMHLGAR